MSLKVMYCNCGVPEMGPVITGNLIENFQIVWTNRL